MKKIFLIIFLGGLLLPLIASAGTYNVYVDENENGKYDEGEQTYSVYYDGVVPCGREICYGEPLNVEEIENALAEGENFELACSMGGGALYRGKQVGDHYLGLPCTFCHFFVMLDGAIDFVLFKIVPPVAILMLVIGGVMFMFAHFGGAEVLPGGAAGGPKMLGQAKKLITSVVIGLIIIFAAWIIITEFFKFIGVSSTGPLQELATDPTKWAQINCPIELPK